jgi:hypothetical protein
MSPSNEILIPPNNLTHKKYFLLSFEYWVTLESSPRKDVRFVLAEDLNDAINKLHDSLSGVEYASVECKNLD